MENDGVSATAGAMLALRQSDVRGPEEHELRRLEGWQAPALAAGAASGVSSGMPGSRFRKQRAAATSLVWLKCTLADPVILHQGALPLCVCQQIAKYV